VGEGGGEKVGEVKGEGEGGEGRRGEKVKERIGSGETVEKGATVGAETTSRCAT